MQVITKMFVQDSSGELIVSNVSHFFTRLRKSYPPKKVLIINNYLFGGNIPKKIFLNFIQIYPFWRLKDQ